MPEAGGGGAGSGRSKSTDSNGASMHSVLGRLVTASLVTAAVALMPVLAT